MTRLTTTDFTACAFLAGVGDDLQPLLRLSHLLTPQPIPADPAGRSARLFVNVTYEGDIPAQPDLVALQQRLAIVDEHYAPGALRLVSGPTPVARHEFDASVLPPPPGLLGPFGALPYTKAFDARAPAACELLFERNVWGERRLLRVIYIRGEALATLWALSHGGLAAPTVLVTVQTGPLEEAGGPMERMLERFGASLPRLWLRGRHPDRWGFLAREDRAALATPSVTMPRCVGHWPWWDGELGVPHRYHQPVDRDPTQAVVLGYAPDEQVSVKVDIERFGDGDRTGALCAGGVSTAKRDALTVIDRERRPFSHGAVDRVVIGWDELRARALPPGVHLPPMPIQRGLELAAAAAQARGLPRVVAEAACFEDEIATARLFGDTQGSPGHVVVAVPGGLGRAGIGDFTAVSPTGHEVARG